MLLPLSPLTMFVISAATKTMPEKLSRPSCFRSTLFVVTIPNPIFGLSILMMKRYLTIVLALVIALQSLVAIGDAAQHHLVPAHHEHAHEGINLDAASPELAEPSDSSNPSPDHSSDHCHQHHSHFHMALLTATTDIAMQSNEQHSPNYQACHTSVIPPSLFRPPIA